MEAISRTSIIYLYEGRFNHYYKLHSCLFLTSTACKTEAKRHFLLPSACSVPKLWPIFCGNVFYVKDDYTVKYFFRQNIIINIKLSYDLFSYI